MTGETVQFDQAGQPDGSAAKREQSTILFPYLDLETAIGVARDIRDTSGLGACEAHELAATMKQTISGAFRLKTGTARIFELTEKDGRAGTKLSQLGRAILEPETERAARAEAFMRVPLYAAIYEKYKGQRLPPMKALEREMAALGVSPKQADKARQAFDRSARQAGYFEHGDDRLVRPRAELPAGDSNSFDAVTGANDDNTKDGKKTGGGSSGGGTGKDHPLIQGLLITLPEPGTQWAPANRKAWLNMAESIFNMIYTAEATPTNSDQLDDLLS